MKEITNSFVELVGIIMTLITVAISLSMLTQVLG
jgi:hypothetical protein